MVKNQDIYKKAPSLSQSYKSSSSSTKEKGLGFGDLIGGSRIPEVTLEQARQAAKDSVRKAAMRKLGTKREFPDLAQKLEYEHFARSIAPSKKEIEIN